MGYTLFCWVYGVFTAGTSIMVGVTHHMAGTAIFWVCMIAVPALTMVFDYLVAYLQIVFRPEIQDLVLGTLAAGQTPSGSMPASKSPSPSSVSAAISGTTSKFPPNANSLETSPGVEVPAKRNSKLLSSLPATVVSGSHRPPDRPLAQQKLPSLQAVLTWRKVLVVMLSAGVVLLLLGLLARNSSTSVSEVMVKYGPLSPTKTDENEYRVCTPGQSCTFMLTARHDMEPPIWVFYGLDPIYHNFNSFLQLRRQQFADKEMANDVFDDVFEIEGVQGDLTDVAWVTDLDRFQCTQGDKCARQIAWMRPSAMTLLRKPYMTLRERRISKGEVVTVTINATFDARPMEAEKELILTTLTSLGGKDGTFGIFLLVSGGMCLATGVAVVVVQRVCAPEPGELLARLTTKAGGDRGAQEMKPVTRKSVSAEITVNDTGAGKSSGEDIVRVVIPPPEANQVSTKAGRDRGAREMNPLPPKSVSPYITASDTGAGKASGEDLVRVGIPPAKVKRVVVEPAIESWSYKCASACGC